MPAYDKKSKTWTGRVRVSGSPQRVKHGFQTKSAASEWELLVKSEIRIPTPEKTDLIFSEACQKYLEYCDKRFQNNTVRYKATAFRQFITHVGHDPGIDEVNIKIVASYLDKVFDEANGKTANRVLREIKALFNWLITNEFATHNPALKIKRYGEKKFVKYIPPIEDIKAVILAASPEEQDFISFVLYTGARLSEVLRLTWEDVNFDLGTARLWTRKRRDGSYEFDEFRVSGTLIGTLKRRFDKRNKESMYVFPRQDGEMGSKNTWDKIMPRLCKKARVKPFGFHSIRHYYASVLMDSGKMSLVEIQKQLRQKRASTTDAYLQELRAGDSVAADVIDEVVGGV
jgi:integrase